LVAANHETRNQVAPLPLEPRGRSLEIGLDWEGGRDAEKWGLLLAWGMIASGLLHAIPFALHGASWEGAVSYRKPILFGISSGLTAWSAICLAAALPPIRWKTGLVNSLAVSLVGEVGLVTLQFWRGVPSHFNRSTAFNAWVEAGLLACITWATIVLILLTIWSFRQLTMTQPMVLAFRWGMVLMIVSCAVGFVITGIGVYQQSLGMPPETYGKAGVLKFPHGIVIHAVQVLPLGVWLLRRLGASSSLQARWANQAGWAMVCLLSLSLAQTCAGCDRTDLWWPSWVLALAAIALFLQPVASWLVQPINTKRLRSLHNRES
jgi:hypothetical protein